MELKDNLIQRINIKQGCERDPEKQLAAIELCKRGIINFFTFFLWTFDPREGVKDIPFVPWEYQEHYIKGIEQDIIKGESSLTEKSRDMGVTWMLLAVFLYRWLFFNESFLLGSRKEELVDKIGDMDTHFERLRYMLNKLPDWMVEACGYDRRNSGYLKIFKTTGASLIGESMTPEFSRQGRYKAILLDEFAFVDNAEMVWRACGDSAPCKLSVSTPNGRANFFSRLRESGKIRVNTLHWRQHPKKDEAWYEKQKESRTERDIAQEIDINYTISSGTPFYGGYREDLHTSTFSFNPFRELLVGWDFGYIHPAVVVTQLDDKDRWIILRESMGHNTTIHHFADHIISMLNTEYPRCRFLHFGDPACVQVNDKSEFTSYQILLTKGVQIIYRQSEYRQRKEIIEHRLHTLHDGKPALLVDKNCVIIREGFKGGYRYPELKDGQQFVKKFEFPFRDGYYEHLMNAMEYIAVNIFSPVASKNITHQDNRIMVMDNV